MPAHADATRERAKGDADAARELAKGNAEAIETVYSAVERHGDAGLRQRELDTLRETANSPNNTYVWANSPLGNLMSILGEGRPPRPEPQAPPEQPSTQQG